MFSRVEQNFFACFSIAEHIMAVKSPIVSTLNPNAPLFVPAAYVATEDFSPEWWRLVQTCPAFRDYWIRERFECMDDGELTAEDLDELEAVEEFMDQHLEEIEGMEEILHLKDDNSDNKEQDQDLAKAINSLDLNTEKDASAISEIS